MAYLEIQVNKKEDFDVIKHYADYKSERTLVCSLSAQGVKALNAKYPGVLKQYLDPEDESMIERGVPDPTAVIEDGKIYVRNGNIEVLSFLDVRSLQNPEMKIINLWKLFDLIRTGVILMDDSFKEVMTPIDEDQNIRELFTSKGRMRFRGKLWSFDQQVDEEFKIRDLKFEECEVNRKRYMTLKDLRVQEFYPKTKTVSLIKDTSASPYVAKFFYITPNMVSLLEKDRLVTMASEKAYGGKSNDYQLVNPMILPQGHQIKHIETLKCSRRYPSALYNAAYSEFLFRKEMQLD